MLWNIGFANDPPRNDPKRMIRRKLTVQPELFFGACFKDQIVGTFIAGFDGVPVESTPWLSIPRRAVGYGHAFDACGRRKSEFLVTTRCVKVSCTKQHGF
jgi:hypothetical protein